MPRYIVSYDLERGRDDEYNAVEEAICANSTSGQKRLATMWIVLSGS